MDTGLPDQLQRKAVILACDWRYNFWHQSESRITPSVCSPDALFAVVYFSALTLIFQIDTFQTPLRYFPG